ncbi:MAG: tetratricopeptide repeat protein [Myxococcales bacterium]|nr:tetratricopeptide repeat protein [Myxococcales bacterium]
MLHASPAFPPCDARQIALAQTALHLILAGQVRFARALLMALGEPPLEEKPGVVAWIHRARAHLASAEGDLSEGLRWTRLAVDGYRLVGDLRNTCSQLTHASSACNKAGCYEKAEAMLREAEALAERLGLKPGRAMARLHLGITLAFLGKLEEAEAMERQAIIDCSEMGYRRLHLGAQVYLARILLRAGRLPEAAQLAQYAADHLDSQAGLARVIHMYCILSRGIHPSPFPGARRRHCHPPRLGCSHRCERRCREPTFWPLDPLTLR